MNENHYTGNLTADPEVRPINSGGVVVRFRIAINGRRHNGQQWVNREPIFKNVVCFRKLADNAAASLRSGMAVTVVGTEVDDSWKPADGDKITRTVIEAVNVSVSLLNATVEVTRNTREQREPVAAATT